MLKAFKFRIHPSEDQKAQLAKAFGCCRFVYNKGLEYRKNIYEAQKKSVSYNTLCTEFLIPLKKEFEFLQESQAQSLQQSLRHLDHAYASFFRRVKKGEKPGFPKFKSKLSRQSLSFPQNVKVQLSSIMIPKIGKVLAVVHRKFDGNIKTCTVSKERTGKYFISILVDDRLPAPPKVSFNGKQIALDLGIKNFLTDSNGNIISNPKFYDKYLDKIKKVQRKLSLKTKGSNNYDKIKIKLAKIHEKICNSRDDFLHKLSSNIINDNQVIIIEDLAVQDLMEKSHKVLARNIGDVSWSIFVRMLKYKAEWRGKHLVQIGRFEPSSKKCSVCGQINTKLKLKDREWECSNCGTLHDRDKNAAKNILAIGLEQAKSLEIPVRESIGSPSL
jgi:putative transposase